MSATTPSTQLKADIKKAYDAIAPKYLTWTESTHKVRLGYVETLLKNLNAGTPEETSPSTSTSTSTSSSPKLNILELGCGAGVPVTQHLSSLPNTTVTANDISETQISLAKTHLPASVTLVQGDMMELTFSNSTFDAVLAMYSIFHLPREEQVTMLTRIYGWLKPGGWLLANFAAGEFERESDGAWLGGNEGVVHWSGWGVEGTRGVLKEIGFGIVVDEVVQDEEGEEDGGVKKVDFHWVMARKV
jgi:ubiquinone/menaquinone biosynthesis C-methylase UbiE